MTARLVGRNGRTFKIERGRIGDATGYLIFERDLEPDVAWSLASGAWRTIAECHADIEKLAP